MITRRSVLGTIIGTVLGSPFTFAEVESVKKTTEWGVRLRTLADLADGRVDLFRMYLIGGGIKVWSPRIEEIVLERSKATLFAHELTMLKPLRYEGIGVVHSVNGLLTERAFASDVTLNPNDTLRVNYSVFFGEWNDQCRDCSIPDQCF